MRPDLSTAAKQTFQVVALLATVLVVGIHYKSDIPDSDSVAMATWNQLTQEFLFGGIARVSVPLFAFAAGFFYFRSHDGSLACSIQKWRQRGRTVALPYFLVASLAMFSWLMIRRISGESVDWTWMHFIGQWLLHPPAEQLWFLRDLMVLVTLAPIINWLGQSGRRCYVALGTLAVAWAANWQPFPTLFGWHVLHIETLFFFVAGMVALRHISWLESTCQFRTQTISVLLGLWSTLLVVRICIRPDFDIWYIHRCGWSDLLLHKASILIGCVALFALCSRVRHSALTRLSGASFFVFLFHEFPLRAVAHRLVERMGDTTNSCWYLTPLVLLICFGGASLMSHWLPAWFAFLTGGRTPHRATSIVGVVRTNDSASQRCNAG
ncbi:acyltransferase family protein [Stieleria varia]|uniref:acyltransferase family protein n=1 Tax=Stieleria varia TaxID=2528005 RepID=UPI0018D22D97|nr:acyltransferase [Stieleria varia]